MNRRGRIAAALVLAAVLPIVAGGCASTTEAAIEVTGPVGATNPTAVTINVFDGYGRIGHAEIGATSLPGSIVVKGLPSRAAELRVVAIAFIDAAEQLGGARVTVRPGQRIAATITVAPGTPDGDDDLVPDDLDDCPFVADALQDNAAGSGAGDACRPNAGDLASGAVDLGAGGGGGDLAGTRPADLGLAASRCATAGVPFCDGFETASLNSHWPGVVAVNGSASVDPTRAYRGASSLHLHQNALAANATSDVEINETQSFPATHLWIRAFVFVPNVFASDDADIVFIEQNVNPYQGILLGLQGTSLHTSNTIAGPRKTSTTPMPRNQWVCLEWDVQLGATGSTALTVEGVAAGNLGGTQNLASTPAAGQLGLSLIATAPAGGIAARDVWIDEVIVDTQPIGCTK
ncbi:MAG: hypothetical protein JWM53_6509 [bacterium]|nr:hypothetical protein [bacterium]